MKYAFGLSRMGKQKHLSFRNRSIDIDHIKILPKMKCMSKLIDNNKNVQLIFVNGLLKRTRILIVTISAIAQGPVNDVSQKKLKLRAGISKEV